MLEFAAPSLERLQEARDWRNSVPETLRTPFLLTKEMQQGFYQNVICNRSSNLRFWAVEDDGGFVGLVGLTNIEWENRLAEISIILHPGERRHGLGTKVIHELLRKGFEELNLENIYAEYYLVNPAKFFWQKIIERYGAYATKLPNRKYWAGKYHDSIYLSIGREAFNEVQDKAGSPLGR